MPVQNQNTVNFYLLNKSFINGIWKEGESSRTYDVLDPFDRSKVISIKLSTKEEVDYAFQSAKKAQKDWAKTSSDERKHILLNVVSYLEEHKEAIIDVLVRETGGTLLKANIEHHLALDVLKEAIHFTDEIHKVKEIPSYMPDKVNHVYRLPLGVITSITPFNFPFNLSMRTIAPAIALGNSVVHKPDIQVALSGGGIIAKAFEEAGLPKGVLNILFTDLQEIGDDLLTHPDSQFISFTGSSKVGRHIGSIAGKHLKRVALELGGNSPFVVLSDANVDQAVNAAIFGKFIHQGQICMIINRMIVHKDNYDEFIEKLTEKAKALPFGDPKDPTTVIGPIINEAQIEKALTAINEAKNQNIPLALEGQRIGNILTPFIFKDVNNSSTLAQTEIFAPVATIIKANSDEEAIAIANDTEYGLSSAIFTSNIERGEHFGLQIESGMTHINDQTVNDSPNIPFGGNKASGLGRFGNPWIVDEFTITKWISIQTKDRQFPF